ncbi:helix-turn-helix domain-containing protein [Galbibacter sp. EGI 63066]|uniref:hybrid sensor histidine kinase/response regulator transcription factor n=1 Tax=Galbibacter sp. EGI 63066 TaxID=2993559 RepID=UPI0022492396|nr:helix-turn-helix domain-containing protein [Galbibacter sp. EGI 63066]MCX2679812.1 helix-turn-helix domain-containing protein [Galbibacter sp. EGI 63066]
MIEADKVLRLPYMLYLFVVLLSCGVCSAQDLFFEKVTGEKINPVTPIHGIAKDSTGYMWFGSWNGAYRYDGKTFDFYYHDSNDNTSLPNNRIRNIISDKEYGLWLLTFDWKYVKYNYSLNNFKIVNDDLVPEIVITKLGNDSNKLNRNNNLNGKEYYLSSHHLRERDIKSGKTYQYTANMNRPGGLLDDYITTFFIDDEQILWLGTRGGDIYKVNTNRNPFELYYGYSRENEKTKLASVRAILKVDDKIWLGTNEGILIYNNNGLVKDHPFYSSNSEITEVRTLLMDSKGGIWIGGVRGLEYYNAETNESKTYISRKLHPDLEIWSVYAIKSSRENTVWIGLYNGLARISLTDYSIKFFNLSKEVNDKSIMDILVVDDNQLWLATEGNGIVRLMFNTKGDISDRSLINTSQTGMHEISGDMIYALHQDKTGAIWMGSSEGLNNIKTKGTSVQINKTPLIPDMPNIYISAITGDNDGNIWVSHKRGITVIEAGTGKISNYHIKDQVSSWTFMERALYKDTTNGKIYFGAKNGYVSFDPQRIKAVSNHDKLVLKSLYVSNEKVVPMKKIKNKPILTKSLLLTKSIELDYQNRNFAIELSLLDYIDDGEGIFEYMLEGHEDTWNQVFGSKVAYNKVPPGTYTFKARPVFPNGSGTSVVTLGVNILSPWYATPLAIVVYVVFLLGVLYLILREILSRERLKNEIKMERMNAEKHEELKKEKLEFFTSVSHELKTPLSLISDPLYRLQSGDLKQDDREIYFSIINRNVKNLSRLINQILDFRKSEKGKLKSHPTSWDFNELVRACYRSFKFIAIKRDIQFDLKVDDEPLYCYLDLEKTEQIIMNVLSNAFKYTSNGGKVVLSAKLNSKKTYLKIGIIDNGVGIEAKALKKIFKPFNNVGSRPFHGNSSGIGLSFTKNLIQLLKGKISIDSLPNIGTKVSIKLPYIEGKKETLSKIQQEATYKHYFNEDEKKVVNKANKPTVLIVEDNPDVQTYLSKELSNEFSILQEYNGKKGLESAVSNIPDLIISDIMMPIMEGTDLCKSIKTKEATSHIPVILLTAKDSDENQIKGYKYGAEAYVTKPFNVGILKAQVHSVLENRMLLEQRLSKITSIDQLQQETTDLDTVFLKKVTERIKEGMEVIDFNAEKLAETLGISQRQLYRKLKAVSGSTVHEYITRVRMDHAENLLLNSDMNVSQVAYKVGYSEPSNFSRTFSKRFGCSPSQYVKGKIV